MGEKESDMGHTCQRRKKEWPLRAKSTVEVRKWLVVHGETRNRTKGLKAWGKQKPAKAKATTI